MEVVRVLLADRQELALAGIRHMLAGSGDLAIVGETGEAKELNRLIEELSPDVLALDYAHIRHFSMAACLKLISHFPFLRILVITADNTPGNILSILQANVLGFITKDCSKQEVLNAFRAVSQGQKFYCNRVLEVLMDKQFNQPEPEPHELLSKREVQIVSFISKGISTQEMADRLHLSPHTVNAHRKNILKKLGVNTPVELIVKAFQLRIIQLPCSPE